MSPMAWGLKGRLYPGTQIGPKFTLRVSKFLLNKQVKSPLRWFLEKKNEKFHAWKYFHGFSSEFSDLRPAWEDEGTCSRSFRLFELRRARVGSRQIPWDVLLPYAPTDIQLPAGLGPRDMLLNVEAIPPFLVHLDSNSIPAEHVAKWKNNFNWLLIPKHLCLGLLMDWAHELGCAHDHLLIANSLENIDKVIISKLSSTFCIT